MSACGAPLPPMLGLLRERARENGWLSDRRIVIDPGEGTTGTTTAMHWMACCGMRTYHWDAAARELAALHPKRYHERNFSRIFEGYDFIADTPISAIFPFVLAAFPNAIILHSTRNSSDWTRSRRKSHPTTARPMAWPFSSKMMPPLDRQFAMGGTDNVLNALAFEAHNSYVRCMVPRGQYLESPMTELCNESFVDQIRRHVGRSCTGCNMSIIHSGCNYASDCVKQAMSKNIKSPHHWCAAQASKKLKNANYLQLKK